MPSILLVPVVGGQFPERPDYGATNSHRRKKGFAIQAVASPHSRPCRFCGEPQKGGHKAFDCDVPIQRGFGWRGWENLTGTRSAFFAMGSPSKKKQKRRAIFADARSKTGVNCPKSTPSKPIRVRSSSGIPENPQ